MDLECKKNEIIDLCMIHGIDITSKIENLNDDKINELYEKLKPIFCVDDYILESIDAVSKDRNIVEVKKSEIYILENGSRIALGEECEAQISYRKFWCKKYSIMKGMFSRTSMGNIVFKINPSFTFYPESSYKNCRVRKLGSSEFSKVKELRTAVLYKDEIILENQYMYLRKKANSCTYIDQLVFIMSVSNCGLEYRIGSSNDVKFITFKEIAEDYEILST